MDLFKFPGDSPNRGMSEDGASLPISPITSDQLEAIRHFDTCSVANAIETFGLRLRNEGYSWPGLMCVTGSFPPMLGYAATCRVKSANPPATGHSYYDRTDWWEEIQVVPAPRVAVIEDIDSHPGLGASVGEVHASILKALNCVGVVTNGSVRDLPAVTAMRFPMFACSVSVSHAYVHMVDFGTPVEVCGLRVHTGDLLYGDCHGLLSIPIEIAARVPAVAEEIASKEKTILNLCRSSAFSLDKLRSQVREL